MASWKRLEQYTVALACALVLGASALTGCAASQTKSPLSTQGEATAAISNKVLVLKDCAVMRDTSFGGVYLDVTIDEFNDLGFSFGDSVDVAFSNGYTLSGIPYYNGYYVRVGDPLVVGYPGYPHVEITVNYGDSLWDAAGLTEDDTATVTLVERGAFRDMQESFDITYTHERSDYEQQTDEQVDALIARIS